MFHITRYIHPGYLSHNLKREIKEMYWFKAIADLATAAIMLFEPIYLVTVLNYNLTQVLYFFLAVYVIYLFIMPLGAKIAATKGYEHAIFYSTFPQIAYWGLLFAAKPDNYFIYFAPLAFAMQKALFWPAFHSDMARFSSNDQRGRENSGLYALISLVFILGPFLGGYLLKEYGFNWLFLMVSILVVLANIPLFTTFEKFEPKPYSYAKTWDYLKKFPKQAIGFWGFGEELTQLVVWPIFIYLTVPDFFEFGTIISASTLVATVIMLYVGILTDNSGKPILIRYLSVLNGIFWIIRSFFSNLPGVIATNTLGTISKNSLIVPVTSLTYDRANQTHIMPYVVFFEQNLVIGKILIILALILLLGLTNSWFMVFLLTGLFSLLFTNLK